MKRGIATVALALALVLACGIKEQKPLAMPVATLIATPTLVLSPTSTSVTTPTPVPTFTFTPTIAPTLTATLVQPASPFLEATSASAAPGETFTLSGSGFPPGVWLVAQFYETARIGGPPGAPLGAAFQTDADGTFSVQATVPPSLFGVPSRGGAIVIPGDYTISVNQITLPFTVGAPSQGALLYGRAFLDINGNSQLDAEDIPWWVLVSAQGPAPEGSTRQAFSDERGYYRLSPVEPGSYHLSTQAEYQSAAWGATATALAEEGKATRVDLPLRPSS